MMKIYGFKRQRVTGYCRQRPLQEIRRLRENCSEGSVAMRAKKIKLNFGEKTKLAGMKYGRS